MTTIASPTAALPQTVIAAPRQSFSDTVLQHFDAWDVDHDGVLSEHELELVIKCADLTGEAAAAAAALKQAVRGGKYIVPPLTREYFSSYAAYAAKHNDPQIIVLGLDGNEEVRPALYADLSDALPKPSSSFPPYLNYYGAAIRREKSTQSFLFAPEAPSITSLKQGQLGDCFFLGVIGAMLNRNPLDVRKMITANSDGSYDVSFPSGKKAHVAPLTDGEIALGSDSSATGRWVIVLEAAYGSLHVGAPASGQAPVVDTDSISKGGSARVVMRTIIGCEADRLLLRNADALQMPEANDVMSKLPRIRRIIGSACSENRLICADTGYFGLPPGITQHHMFAVIGFDGAADTITLWNPHGQSFLPLGEPGLKNGFPTRNGRFTVSTSEFARIFSNLSWQLKENSPTDAPPSAPTPARHIRGMGVALPQIPPIVKLAHSKIS